MLCHSECPWIHYILQSRAVQVWFYCAVITSFEHDIIIGHRRYHHTSENKEVESPSMAMTFEAFWYWLQLYRWLLIWSMYSCVSRRPHRYRFLTWKLSIPCYWRSCLLKIRKFLWSVSVDVNLLECKYLLEHCWVHGRKLPQAIFNFWQVFYGVYRPKRRQLESLISGCSKAKAIESSEPVVDFTVADGSEGLGPAWEAGVGGDLIHCAIELIVVCQQCKTGALGPAQGG